MCQIPVSPLLYIYIAIVTYGLPLILVKTLKKSLL